MQPSLTRTLAGLPALALLALTLLALTLLLPAAAPGQGTEGPVLTVAVAADGAIRASGTAPPGFPLRELRRRVPALEASVESGGESAAERWADVLDAMTIVLPRLAEGEVRLGEDMFAVDGTLRPGFSAEATRGALRLTLGPGWQTRIDLAEAPPAAALAVTWSRHGAVVSGILPEGLAPAEALSLLGGPAEGIVHGGLVDAGTTGGGGGDAAAWRAALPLLGRLLPAYRHAVVRLGGGRLSVDGPLEPGQDAGRLQDWLSAQLGDAWQASVTGVERPAAEGATRKDPVTGHAQELIGGRWIPVLSFAPDPPACGRRSSAVLAAQPLTFVSGKTTLAEGAAEILDRLAGIARRCLNEGGLTLRIGGHTDSIGNAAENRALSEERAMTVLLELVTRGVRADAMQAVGHGESRAIAGNDTEAGRARNRRITFAWSE